MLDIRIKILLVAEATMRTAMHCEWERLPTRPNRSRPFICQPGSSRRLYKEGGKHFNAEDRSLIHRGGRGEEGERDGEEEDPRVRFQAPSQGAPQAPHRHWSTDPLGTGLPRTSYLNRSLFRSIHLDAIRVLLSRITSFEAFPCVSDLFYMICVSLWGSVGALLWATCFEDRNNFFLGISRQNRSLELVGKLLMLFL